MPKIVLLRHGESIWNKENLFTGWTDVDLSEKGHKPRQSGLANCSRSKGSPSKSPTLPS